MREKFYKEYKSNLIYNTYERFVLAVVLGSFAEPKYLSKWGYLYSDGSLKIDFIYEKVKDFKNGFAEVCFQSKWGVINKEGKVVIPIKYDELYKNKENDLDLFKVELNGKNGYVDLNGVEYFTND